MIYQRAYVLPRKVYLLLLAFAFAALAPLLSWGAASTGSAVSITCPVDGSSTEVLAASAARLSYAIINTSTTDVRVGYLTSGTADLTDSNSYVQKAGVTYADSGATVFLGRIVCMSTSGASTATIYVTETRRR